MEEGPSPPSPLELTEEQRQRAEFNRLRALAKRKALLQQQQQQQSSKHSDYESNLQNPSWGLFKCRTLPSLSPFPSLSSEPVSNEPLIPCPNRGSVQNPDARVPERFRLRFEICSPDSFSVTPEPVNGFSFPGEEECFAKLEQWLSNVMVTHFTQNQGGGKASVYNLKEYEDVLKCLKNFKDIEVEEIPWTTFNVVEKFSHSFALGRWMPCRPEHLADEAVEELMSKLPKRLLDTLLPFQLDGLKFGLRRGGRCLIADEMGLGKTLQAIAVAGCFANEGPILVVCPAILRFQWAEELEHWLPSCLPSDIHLVCGHKNNPANLPRCPKVVVTSYTMLSRLRKSLLEMEWAVLVVDESHHIRCSKKKEEVGEVKAVIDVASKVARVIFLSGTPSLSRPGLLGQTKYDFAKTYCSMRSVACFQGKTFLDVSRGCRLQELNVLLCRTVMIRRLKENLLRQLPPKRRQIIRLSLKKSDIILAKNAVAGHGDLPGVGDAKQDNLSDIADEVDDVGDKKSSKRLSPQELGIAKVSGFLEWLSLHPIVTEGDGSENVDMNCSGNKMIIFAHHHVVLDKVQEFLCDKAIGFIRIDGKTSDADRQSSVKAFQSSKEIKVAIIGIKVGYAGLDLSVAQSIAFLELPGEPTSLLQAEDRAHRRGQTKAVNIYIFCAMDTGDESLWQRLNKSLFRVSTTTNGKHGAVPELEVDSICYLGNSGNQLSATGSAPVSVTEEKSPQVYSQDHEASGVSGEQNSSFNSARLIYGGVAKICAFHCVSRHHLFRVEGLNCHNLLALWGKGMPGGEILHETQSEPDKKPDEPPEAGSLIRADTLRFEVSQYTGRIHLWTCIPEVDSRPRALYENFRPEEIISESSKYASRFLKENPACQNALLVFIDEWNNLRRVDRRKLLGKPLQLPLSVELSYLYESSNHDDRGLLKGGSRRRNTPLCDISLPLPTDAVWKQVWLTGNKKKDRVYMQAWSTSEEPLCKLCQNPCKGSNAKRPEFFEDLFCNLSCSEEYRSRTSNGYLRQELFKIERGICTNCNLDCHKLVLNLRPMALEKRVEYVQRVAPNLASRKNLLDKLVSEPIEGNAWHADHYIPVYQGGGECRVENLRTLCTACHADVTAAQCVERKLARKQLREAVNKLKVGRKRKTTRESSKVKSTRTLKAATDLGEDNDDFLLVQVPGSSYSKESTCLTESSEEKNLQISGAQ